MEQAKLAGAVRLLRSGAKSHFAEPPHGPPRRAAIGGGICPVSRDAACEASDTALGLQPGLAFARVPPGREALCGIRARAPGARSLGALKGKKEITQRRRERRDGPLLLLSLDFVAQLVDFLADFVTILGVRIKIEIPRIRCDGLLLQALLFLCLA